LWQRLIGVAMSMAVSAAVNASPIAPMSPASHSPISPFGAASGHPRRHLFDRPEPGQQHDLERDRSEGATLNVPGLINFNHTAGGDNIIIQTG
jgi:hypothetical protein